MNPLELELPFEGPLDLKSTLGSLRSGFRDPSLKLDAKHALWALHTPEGPASLRINLHSGRVLAEAWGPGAERALSELPESLGLKDDPSSFEPEHPKIRRLHRHNLGMRLARTRDVASLLVPIVLGQLVTSREAAKAYLNLVWQHGEPAPGPLELRLRPHPSVLARLDRAHYIACGGLGRQGDTIRALCQRARRMNEAVDMSLEDASRRLQAIRGLGPWTAHMAMVNGMGFADAVATGDFHLPNVVSWVFADEPRGTDERMLELLEPYRPHRGRVIRLLLMGGVHAPKRGPRHRIRDWSTR